jgi:hypothetical protein
MPSRSGHRNGPRRGGKIVEGWNSWDQLGLLRQIGALDHPAAGDRFLAR